MLTCRSCRVDADVHLLPYRSCLADAAITADAAMPILSYLQMTTVVRLALLSDAEDSRTTASNPLAFCSLLRNYGRIRATSNDLGGLVCLPWSLIRSHRSNPRLISSCCASWTGAFENELMTDMCKLSPSTLACISPMWNENR